jgi:hypothetical protein
MTNDGDKFNLIRQFDLLHANKQSLFFALYLTLLSIIASVAIGLVANKLGTIYKDAVLYDLLTLPLDEIGTIMRSIATVLVVTIMLAGYVLTISYYYWHVTPRDAFIPMSLGIAICFMGAFVDQPAIWLVSTFSLSLVAGLTFTYTSRQLKKGLVPLVEAMKKVEPISTEVQSFLAAEFATFRRYQFVCFGVSSLIILYPVLNKVFIPYHRILIPAIIIIGCLILTSIFHKTRQRREDTFSKIRSKL